MSRQSNQEQTIISLLGMISIGCIVGVIVLEGMGKGGQSEALQTIASLCVGALASRITQQVSTATKNNNNSQEDADYVIIGRAATRSMIVQAVRQLAESEKG